MNKFLFHRRPFVSHFTVFVCFGPTFDFSCTASLVFTVSIAAVVRFLFHLFRAHFVRPFYHLSPSIILFVVWISMVLVEAHRDERTSAIHSFDVIFCSFFFSFAWTFLYLSLYWAKENLWLILSNVIFFVSSSPFSCFGIVLCRTELTIIRLIFHQVICSKSKKSFDKSIWMSTIYKSRFVFDSFLVVGLSHRLIGWRISIIMKWLIFSVEERSEIVCTLDRENKCRTVERRK